MLALAIRKQDTLWGRESYGIRYGIRRELATEPYLPRSVLPSLSSGTFYAALLALAALGLYLRRRRTDALTARLVLSALMMSPHARSRGGADRYRRVPGAALYAHRGVCGGRLVNRAAEGRRGVWNRDSRELGRRDETPRFGQRNPASTAAVEIAWDDRLPSSAPASRADSPADGAKCDDLKRGHAGAPINLMIPLPSCWPC